MSESKDEEGSGSSESGDQFEHLFQGLQCKFEGLLPKSEEHFIKLVTEMGAKVSKKAGVSFVHKSYFEKDSRRVNFYNIDYINDSVCEGKALNLDDYRFSPDQKDYRCKTSSKRDSSISLDSTCKDRFSCTQTGPIRKKIKNSVEEETNSDSVVSRSAVDSQLGVHSDSQSSKNNKKFPSQSSHKRQTSLDHWVKPKQSVDTEADASSSTFILTDDEEKKYFKDKKLWWIADPVPNDERCTRDKCRLEPNHHPKHLRFGKFLSLVEKKVLLKYLISNNAIKHAKGQAIYEQMIGAGYLAHRSWQTLHNCFRRTIIREIEGYRLDEGQIKQFSELKNKKKLKRETKGKK